MYGISEMFWDATVPELKKGYVWDEKSEAFVCLVCGKLFIKGLIYEQDGIFYEAEKFTTLHVADEHGGMLQYLLGLDKKLTGLTDLQKNLVKAFYEGLGDQEIAKRYEVGSTSTIRNHRFTLREKMKQAKIYLTILEMMEEKAPAASFVPVHRTATMVDERYVITTKENDEIIKKFFKEGPEGPLSHFPKKQKMKITILRHIMNRFVLDKKYSEKEVNEILRTADSDYVTLRRSLIEYGFLDRKDDGSMYWVKEY